MFISPKLLEWDTYLGFFCLLSHWKKLQGNTRWHYLLRRIHFIPIVLHRTKGRKNIWKMEGGIKPGPFVKQARTLPITSELLRLSVTFWGLTVASQLHRTNVTLTSQLHRTLHLIRCHQVASFSAASYFCITHFQNNVRDILRIKCFARIFGRPLPSSLF